MLLTAAGWFLPHCKAEHIMGYMKDPFLLDAKGGLLQTEVTPKINNLALVFGFNSQICIYTLGIKAQPGCCWCLYWGYMVNMHC